VASALRGYWLYVTNASTGEVDTAPCLSGLCIGGSDVSNQCGPHRKRSADNVLCGSCEAGSAQQGSRCVPCTKAEGGAVFGLLLSLFLLTLLLHVTAQRNRQRHTLAIATYFIQAATLMIGAREAVMGWLSLLNADFLSASSGICVIPMSSFEALIVSTFSPVSLFMVLLLMALSHRIFIATCARPNALRSSSLTTNESLQDQLLDAESTGVSSDLWTIEPVEASLTSDESQSTRHDLWAQLLVLPFKPHSWWYQSYSLGRRALVALVDVALLGQDRKRFGVLSILHLVFLLIQVNILPFHNDGDNRLEMVLLSLLITVFTLLSIYPPPFGTGVAIAVTCLITVPFLCNLLYMLRGFVTPGALYINARKLFAAGLRRCRACMPGATSDSMAVSPGKSRRFKWRDYRRTLLVLLVFTYSQFCTWSFRYLACVRVGHWRVAYYMPAVSCDDPSYQSGLIGVVFLLVYVSVLPLALSAIAWRKRVQRSSSKSAMASIDRSLTTSSDETLVSQGSELRDL